MMHNGDRARVSRRRFLTGTTAAGAGLAVEWIAAAPPAVGRKSAPPSEQGRSTAGLIPVGAAKVDVTPDYPVRLPGYAGRTTESEGVLQRLWAKALAIGSDQGDGPAVMLTLDNCGVPQNVTEEVAARLKAKAGIKRQRVAICSSHTHTAPWLEGFLPLHYVEPIPREHQDRIRRYTRQATDWLEQAALQAISSRTPGRLAWAQGRVGFAANRRVLADGKWVRFGVNPDGPVDHSLPILRVTDGSGKLLAVAVNYACHCTTMSGNSIHGDWAGCAQQYIEEDHPGAVAMISIGCGGDANPEPRTSVGATEGHGRALADEVSRLLAGPFVPLEQPPVARLRRIELPFDTPPTQEEFSQRLAGGRLPNASASAKRLGYHAQRMLEHVRRDGRAPAKLGYHVTTWTFGRELAMILLPGEVVVDYALRLKRELDSARLWVTAYVNDVPCYIPSKRILKEGGYETESSMISYAQPTRFSPAVEDRIVATAKSLLPEGFRSRATE
jgi:hypothetical protein